MNSFSFNDSKNQIHQLQMVQDLWEEIKGDYLEEEEEENSMGRYLYKFKLQKCRDYDNGNSDLYWA